MGAFEAGFGSLTSGTDPVVDLVVREGDPRWSAIPDDARPEASQLPDKGRPVQWHRNVVI